MKNISFYIVTMTFIYTLICGLGWSWALNLDFELWKLPIIGAANAFLQVVMNAFARYFFEAKE